MSAFGLPDPPEPLSALAVAALRELAKDCNQNNGFVTPTEKKLAVRYLRALRFVAKEQVDPRSVEEWARTEGGWTDRQAKDLRDIVDGVYTTPTKRFRDYDGTPIRTDEAVERAMVDRWRSAAAGE